MRGRSIGLVKSQRPKTSQFASVNFELIFCTFNPGSSSTLPFHPFSASWGVSTVYSAGSSGSARHVSQMKERAAIQSVPYKTTLKSLSARAVIRSMLAGWRACGQKSRMSLQENATLDPDTKLGNGAKTRGHLQATLNHDFTRHFNQYKTRINA